MDRIGVANCESSCHRLKETVRQDETIEAQSSVATKKTEPLIFANKR
jgi:hypothetical protein